MKAVVVDDIKLIKEWNWEKNDSLHLDPKLLTLGSNKKVWWVCKSKHEWKDSIVHRTNGRNCPYCSNHRLLQGFNDLATIRPDLVNEWNYVKNENLTPSEVFPSSNKKRWWICKNGHEWEDTPNHRVNRNNGCPYCSNHRLLQGFNDLATTHPNLVKQWNYKKNGKLFPTDVLHGSQQKVWWICENGHEWNATIASRSFGVGCPYCNKELQTSYPEQAVFFYIKKIFPDSVNRYIENDKEIDVFIPAINLGIEYDGERFHTQETKIKEQKKDEYYYNKGIKLIRIKEKKNSKTRVENNVIYYSPSYTNNKLNDVINLLIDIIFEDLKMDKPLINISVEQDNKYILELLISTKKENSILTNEILAKEWNYKKNEKLNPEYILKTSGKKVWWKCNKGHEWEAIVNSRNRGNGCPYCSNQKVLSGYNDLLTINPNLAKEWNYKKNGKLEPNSILAGTNKKVWWKYNKGHEWQAVVSSRNKGAGCPYCSNQKVLVGINDLVTIRPDLTKEWNYDKNVNLTPNDFFPNSGKKVWWKCSKGHEWEATVTSRNKGTGCPYCSNRRILKGYNDLATFRPDLVKEWNYDKNVNLTPTSISLGSSKKVWWKCSKGHEWEAIVTNRIKGNGCPYCGKRKRKQK